MKILERTHDEFVDACYRRYGRGAGISTTVYRHVMKTGNVAFHDSGAIAAVAPDLAHRLKRELLLTSGRIVDKISDRGVVKFVTRLPDGLDIETVVIPMYRRHTLCVSSQVGCRMGCRFCRTGRLRLIRNLTAAEIVGQVFDARFRLGCDIRNVVFMGMGEPLDNFDNVVQAIRVLNDQRGLDIARRYTTVSTAGLIGGIDQLAISVNPPVNLAVSLNASNDDVRSQLMPINRKAPMAALRESLMRYPLNRKSTLFIEYVLIQGVNDSKAHARELARYLAPLKAKLNLIAYNQAPGSDFRPPSVDAFARFHGWLVDLNVFVRRRGERGARIMAACGQLGGQGTKRPLGV